MARVVVETVLPHSAPVVWQRIAAFADIAHWHPLIGASRLRAGDDQTAPGCIRELTTIDGRTLTERLASYDAQAMVLVYEFVEHPFPVTDYQATMRVLADSDGHDRQCVVQWTADFEPCSGDGSTERDFFAGQVFTPGLIALDNVLAQPAMPHTVPSTHTAAQ
ncbi:SRPBCC family protein [Nocardia fluminea]|uniref:Polyketide cyclase/dehydrase/lipid transport protein n=1 Tax=Nocardia fluminea TaxID=134984 RepID=A0A2N3V9Y8_9NOCA|nr:SRPBCC family protein [Nocardia fluminea]PKV78459.1 polyketide cyclase/dehydrase/lipid transport protein [Nocardia fluminea]